MIDIQACTAPIPGENPAGEDLRYTPVYDTIKEARKADDMLARGDWEREIKTSDWAAVIKTSVDALTTRTKDLQIAAWLTEALVKTKGFEGLNTGLVIINGLLDQYWDTVYPLIEDGDMEFRAGPFEFLNDKLWSALKDIPLTDPAKTPGYSWLSWQDSRKVGTEKDILNQFGDVDEKKRRAREDLIAEGKIPAEEFDAAVAATSKAFYEKVEGCLNTCLAEFDKMDGLVDEKFGKEAPRLSEMRAAIQDCEQLISRILKDRRVQEPDKREVPMKDAQTKAAASAGGVSGTEYPAAGQAVAAQGSPSLSPGAVPAFFVQDGAGIEDALWEAALQTVNQSGIRQALEQLTAAVSSAPSVRQQNRYRLLIAKLCLKVNRHDLARPVIEQLYTLIGELSLEKWESPTWIAEVIDAYYQCLTADEASDEDKYKAKNELFQKLCNQDITKAFVYKG